MEKKKKNGRTEIKREKSQEREEREQERGGTGNFQEKESEKRENGNLGELKRKLGAEVWKRGVEEARKRESA